jgi:hypothetical protein
MLASPRRLALLVLVLGGLPLAAAAGPGVAPQAPTTAPDALPPRLLGAWRLLSIVDHCSDGTDRPLPGLGTEVTGFLVIDASGLACLQAMRRQRPRWAEREGKDGPDDAELAAHGRGFLAWCAGDLRRRDGSLVGRITSSSDPNQVGAELVRPFEVGGDRLTLDTSFWAGGLRVRRVATFERWKGPEPD